MKLQTTVLLSLFVVTFFSCENKKTEQATQTEKMTTEVKAAVNDMTLNLNDGVLWEANKETTEGVNAMIELTDSFATQENQDIASYKTLATNLEQEFQMIFKKCTMKGEAHNQLHNFLIPIKNKFKQLSSEDIDERKKGLEDLQKHLAIYKDYFKS